MLFSPPAIFLTPSSNYKRGPDPMTHLLHLYSPECWFLCGSLILKIVWCLPHRKRRCIYSRTGRKVDKFARLPPLTPFLFTLKAAWIRFRLLDHTENLPWNRCLYYLARSPYHQPLVLTMPGFSNSTRLPAK